MDKLKTLSKNLKSIYDLEISLGNEVSRIDDPAGTNCSLAVIFRKPLHFTEIVGRLSLNSNVRRWENIDRHYPLEEGFICEQTNHVLAGPIGDSK